MYISRDVTAGAWVLGWKTILRYWSQVGFKNRAKEERQAKSASRERMFSVIFCWNENESSIGRRSRAEGRFKNPGGTSSNLVDIIYPPLGWNRVTDLPKSGGPCPLVSPAPRSYIRNCLVWLAIVDIFLAVKGTRKEGEKIGCSCQKFQGHRKVWKSGGTK